MLQAIWSKIIKRMITIEASANIHVMTLDQIVGNIQLTWFLMSN